MIGMTKYKKYFQEMVEGNSELFEVFKDVHDGFLKDPKKWQKEFDEKGKKVWEVINEWEKRLCTQIEGGKNAVFSGGLSDKFRDEIKKIYPKIEMVGVKIKFG
jgi:uncharacterized protein YciU (UPF0263 family)